MSEYDPKPPFVEPLLDQLGLYEQRPRHGETERLSGLQVDDEFELGRPLDRQVGRLGALAEARDLYEVKEIHDKAMAMELYAKQAKDTVLLAYGIEKRMWAERRLGELIDEDRKAGRLAKGTRFAGSTAGASAGCSPVCRWSTDDHPTLASRGIDKNLAHRARKAFSIQEKEFEAHIAKTLRVMVAASEGDQAAIVREAHAERQNEKRQARDEREKSLAAKQVALPIKKYDVIYADPPCASRLTGRKLGMDRADDNHYPTLTVDYIKALAVPQCRAVPVDDGADAPRRA